MNLKLPMSKVPIQAAWWPSVWPAEYDEVTPILGGAVLSATLQPAIRDPAARVVLHNPQSLPQRGRMEHFLQAMLFCHYCGVGRHCFALKCCCLADGSCAEVKAA
mmetsp:Transcript_100301/g.198923  ORF Transcript_100301/g.198923 Transcript_100301/m.198923 type:complete len:105 (-) Transcript_100301:28-342(-)